MSKSNQWLRYYLQLHDSTTSCGLQLCLTDVRLDEHGGFSMLRGMMDLMGRLLDCLVI